MQESERALLVSQWSQALTMSGAASMSASRAQQLLGGLVDELAAGLDNDPFGVSAGLRVGAALVHAGLRDPGVPTESAQVLYRMAASGRGADSERRMAGLLAALVQGYQEELQSVRRAAEGRYRAAVENAQVALAIGDTKGNLVYANRFLAELLGVPLESVLTTSIYDFAHPDEREEIKSVVYSGLVPARQGTVHLERRMVRTDGSIRWLWITITYVPGSDSLADFLLAVGEDVTERHRLQEELHWQARHDQLTELPNRRRFIECIDTLAATAGPNDRIGLYFTDVDQFKEINDNYGHAVGDRVLVAVAQRLRAAADEDCVCARFHGDEFVILVPPPVDDHRAAAVADRLLSALAAPVTVGEHQLHVSVSIGGVVTAVAGSPAEDLLDAADRALYQAKTSGRHRWIIHTLDSPTQQ